MMVLPLDFVIRNAEPMQCPGFGSVGERVRDWHYYSLN